MLEGLRELEEVSGDPLAELGEDDGEDLKDLMEEADDPGLSEGDVRVGTKLNAQWKKEMEAATKPFPIQNITLMEVLSSKSTKDVIPALSRLLARFRALGIPTYRFHSDRARELLARPVRDFHNMVQTATCGDDPPSNGRASMEKTPQIDYAGFRWCCCGTASEGWLAYATDDQVQCQGSGED